MISVWNICNFWSFVCIDLLALKGWEGMLKIADRAFMAVGAHFELTNFTASKTETTKGCSKCSNLIAMDHR